MRQSAVKKIFLVLLIVCVAVSLQALDLTIYGQPKAVLKIQNGDEVIIDPSGKYVIHDLKAGDVISFTAEIPGHVPADYSVEMGELSRTFRINPEPTGLIAAELKFTDADFCPGIGLEFYFVPQNAYISVDLYQSFFSVASLFVQPAEQLSTRYIMPMLGAGVYILPFDSFIRINLGVSAGGMFGNELPHPLFAAELAAGLELKFFENYILFAEFNPRLMSPVSTGWENYTDIFGSSRADSMFNLGPWGLMGFPSTIFGFKIKY